MKTTTTSVLVLAGLLLGTTAEAAKIMVGPVAPDPEGRVVCTVENIAQKDLTMRVEIRTAKGENVTDFYATSWMDEAGTVPAAVVAESQHDAARYCRVVVRKGRRRDLSVVVESFDAAGETLETLQP